MASSGRLHKGGLDFVSCDECGRWDLFENCKRELGLDKFDRKEIGRIRFCCRMCKFEDRIKGLEARVLDVESRVGSVQRRITEMDSETECKVIVVKGEVADVKKDLEKRIGEIESKVAVVELSVEEEWKRVEEVAKSALSQAEAVKLNLSQKDWPTPAQAAEAERKQKCKGAAAGKKTKVSFSQKVKDKAKDTVLVVGDSMARGIGDCLVKDSGGYSGMCSKVAVGGARIQDIQERIAKMGEKPESHLVVVVGTNNLFSDASEKMMSRYKDLVEEIKKHRFRKVSFVGIMKRKVNKYVDSKRIGINFRLEKLCEDNDLGFIDPEITVELEHLSKDGLHLNRQGQDEVARQIFKHCIHYLN